MKKFDLINSEGSILSIAKQDGSFIVYDADNFIIATLSKYALGLFLNGEISLADGKHKLWNMNNVEKGMKYDPNKLTQYLLTNKTEING